MESESPAALDDMGSLFEGMVLFNPLQMLPDESNAADSASATPAATSSSTPLPLDENLFSNLTLIPTPSPQDLDDDSVQLHSVPSSTAPPSSNYSRQGSNLKKKKKAGLRIGYGRAKGRDRNTYRDVDADKDVDGDEDGDVSSPVPVDEKEEDLESDPPSRINPDEDEHHSVNGIDAVDSSNRIDDYSSSSGLEVRELDDQSRNRQEESRIQGGGEEDGDKPAGGKMGGVVEARFEQIRARISEKLKQAREAVASVSLDRKESIRRRRNAAEKVTQATAKYKEIEKELDEACEAEDFERAEMLSEGLASAEKERELAVIALRESEAYCDTVDSMMQEALESHIQTEEECAALLSSYAMDASSTADLVLKNAEATSSKEMEEWFSSSEAVEVKKIELEIESQLIHEARMVLDDSIDQTVEDDRRERDVLYKKKEIMIGELEELLALVKKKEAEIGENDILIKKVEERISGVVSGFQETRSTINTKYDDLQSSLSHIFLEQESLSRKKEEIDSFLREQADRGAKIRELSKNSSDEARTYQEVVGLQKSLVQFILKSREDRAKLGEKERNISEDVKSLEQEISATRLSLQELSSSKLHVQQDVESSRQRLIFIDKRIPELEAEKKVAATSRNFKEAARLAAEAKVLSVEKEGILEKIEDGTTELGKLEEDIGSTIDKLQQTETQISSKEKELAMARYQRLILVSGAASAERSAALELGDLEEADVLLAEAEAAATEAGKIQSVYAFQEEEILDLPKHFLSMELVSKLGVEQLAELASLAQIFAS